MRIGIVFHKDPFAPPTGIDLVRLRAIAGGLVSRGVAAEIISPVDKEGLLEDIIPVRRLEALSRKNRYDLVKTSYHFSIELINNYRGPVVSRIVRVVDQGLPERDEAFRQRLLQCQQRISARADRVVLNNSQNAQRWRRLYGDKPPTVLVPTGCPATIPPPGCDPFAEDAPVILFVGSLAAPRMVTMLNAAATRLQRRCAIHLVGLNKACMYGGGAHCRLHPLIVDHGEVPEPDLWDYIRHADVGLALATGPHPFDNDVSKIFNYLRGGLPVLSEEPIVNNELIRQTGYGSTFTYGDVDDLVLRATELLDHPPVQKREWVMDFMAEEHSWDTRVETYLALFREILGRID